VNERLMKAPRWVLCLINAGILGAFWILFLRFLAGETWTGALSQGAPFGVVCGLMTGLMLHAQFRRLREAVRDEEVAGRVAGRPTLYGPIPEDPGERAATARLIDHQLVQIGRRRVLTIVLQVGVIAVGGYLAVTRSPWWWAAVALGVFLLVGSLVLPGRLERRAELLREMPPAH
jgi:hypothetical protein